MSDDKALIPVEQKTVVFYDDNITAVQIADGMIYIPIRPICEQLGINWGGQRERIQRDAVLSQVVRSVRVTRSYLNSNRDQNVLCLPLDYLNGWLFGINANRVKEESRDLIIRYQMECYRVLFEAFQEGQLNLDPTFDELLSRADKDVVEAYQLAQSIMKLARNQVLLSSKLDDHEARLQLIEADLGNEARYITNSQAMQLSQAVKMVALELGKQTGGNEFQGVWGELHRRYQISSYLKLPAMRFDEAIGFLREWWESLTDEGEVPF